MGSKSKWTQEELIALFIELEREIGMTPSSRMWDKSKLTPGLSPVINLFGSWNNFVKAAGGGRFTLTIIGQRMAS